MSPQYLPSLLGGLELHFVQVVSPEGQPPAGNPGIAEPPTKMSGYTASRVLVMQPPEDMPAANTRVLSAFLLVTTLSTILTIAALSPSRLALESKHCFPASGAIR